MGEWNNATLDVEDLDNNLHNTKELKKSCQDRNNARNRCMFSRAKASGNLTEIKSFLAQKEKELLFDELRENVQDDVDSHGESSETTEDFDSGVE